ncbi:hypothetical protein [Comamonas composti]|uniref:hypothetical protein n=1 Tax=Comamonas composti TaxID=408558 RepID=UPI0012EB0DDF|nr:hypothetical protein [Comamonas composti]
MHDEPKRLRSPMRALLALGASSLLTACVLPPPDHYSAGSPMIGVGTSIYYETYHTPYYAPYYGQPPLGAGIHHHRPVPVYREQHRRHEHRHREHGRPQERPQRPGWQGHHRPRHQAQPPGSARPSHPGPRHRPEHRSERDPKR